MKPPTTALRRIAALTALIVVVGAIFAAGPLAVSSQDGGVSTPTPQPDGDYDCSQFDTREQVGAVFDPDNDEYGLDRDDDGIACEDVGDNPTPEGASGTPTDTPTDTPTATATATEEPTDTATATEEPAETPTETTTDTPTQTAADAETTETATEDTDPQTATEETAADAANETAYYQVDFVTGDPIEDLRGPNGTYSNDELIRFAHGSTDEPVMRRSEGEFTTDDALADRIESEDIGVENDTATVTFTVSDGDPVALTLASYEKTGPGWSPETEADQEFVDSDTETFDSGTHTLTVGLPDENSSD